MTPPFFLEPPRSRPNISVSKITDIDGPCGEPPHHTAAMIHSHMTKHPFDNPKPELVWNHCLTTRILTDQGSTKKWLLKVAFQGQTGTL